MSVSLTFHWTTSAPGGDAGWVRVGTLTLDGKPMISTANCSDKASHRAALWSPVAFFEDNSWFMTYVAYDCPRNIDGQIKLTKSTVPGPGGISGPYASSAVPGCPGCRPGVLLARGADGGNASQPWESIQGVDSFFAFHAPTPVAARSGRAAAAAAAAVAPPPPPPPLLAFYGSSRFGWPWNVGLAASSSGKIGGPWVRLPHGNPLAIDGGKTENPIVIEVTAPAAAAASGSTAEAAKGSSNSTSMLLMLHDWVTDGAKGFGMTWSLDGITCRHPSGV